jgi:hypothetical protein
LATPRFRATSVLRSTNEGTGPQGRRLVSIGDRMLRRRPDLAARRLLRDQLFLDGDT